MAPGGFEQLHWSTPVPAHAAGSDAEIYAAFGAVFEQLRTRIEEELP